MKKALRWSAAGLAFALLCLMAAIRLAPSDPAEWHVDPLTVAHPDSRNSYLSAPPGVTEATPDQAGPEFALDPIALAEVFDKVVMSAPRTRRLAGSPSEGWTTYVQRSLIMGYPDYISVHAVKLKDGKSALAIFSRSRFGEGDFGVNAARVKRWLQALERLAQ